MLLDALPSLVNHPLAPAPSSPRLRALGRRRVRRSLVTAAHVVTVLAVVDGLGALLLLPSPSEWRMWFDVALAAAGLVMIGFLRGWQRVPEATVLVAGSVLISALLVGIALNPRTAPLNVAYLVIFVVATPILLPWSTRYQAAFAAICGLVAAAHLLGPLGALEGGLRYQLLLAILAAIGTSAVAHATLKRFRLAGFEQRERLRSRNAELRSERANLSRREAQLAGAEAVARAGSWNWVIATGHLEWSDGQRRLFGVGSDFTPSLDSAFELIHPAHRAAVQAQIEQALVSGRFEGDMLIVRPSGDERWLSSRGQVVETDADGTPTRMMGTSVDITERKRAEDVLARLALSDHHTGLANSTRFRESVDEALSDPERSAVVMLVDLDDFKTVNDRLGHAAGDAVLSAIAGRLQAAIRQADTAARLGGDEFALLLRDVSLADAEEVGRRLLRRLAEPVEINGHLARVGATIGVARADPGLSADEVLRRADLAMYAGKHEGKQRLRVHDASMDRYAREIDERSYDLRQALRDDRIRVAYEPVQDLKTGHLVGFEAVAQWDHPRRGLLAANDFIGLAEDANVIVEIDRFVLERAASDARGWRDAGVEMLRLTTNLALKTLQSDDLFPLVARAVDEVRPWSIGFETPEAAALHDFDGAVEATRGLRSAGASVIIDHFGTGHSTLAELGRLGIDAVKIDGTYVRDPSSHGLLKALIEAGHALGARVGAEGVETVEQLELLRVLGCREAQGPLLGRPMNAAAVADFVSDSLMRTDGGAAMQAVA